ncbi:terpene synthase family protein [Streptomyces natalensis]|uniref:Terpene synthase n=1 Tax=Streptomyces natalensis ATCC 27448 TaxID=1240678 RepID=A0A0D7CIP9_9ACTN|nr:terpene synthase family protein [Streptomyces natalensis]KIZ15710.1 hypothetical protein SNA_24840 [Streptomyces natalensis ATCC 27448]
MRKHAADACVGDFASRVCLETSWSEPFQLMVDMVHLMFLVDDFIDGSVTVEGSGRDLGTFVRVGHAFLHILKDPDSRAIRELGIFGPAVRDIARRVHELGNHPYLLRFTRDVREWFTSCFWQSADLADGRRLGDLNSITERATDIAGHGVFTPFFPFLTPGPVSLEVLDSRDMRDLVELMATLCEVYNHMVSLGKDLWLSEQYPLHADATSLSTVAQLAQTDGIPLDEALRRAADLTSALTGQFHRLYTQMNDAADPATAYYLRTVAQTIRGSFDWHLTTPRYTNPDGKHPGAVTITATTQDTPPADQGPPVPAAARWWRT